MSELAPALELLDEPQEAAAGFPAKLLGAAGFMLLATLVAALAALAERVALPHEPPPLMAAGLAMSFLALAAAAALSMRRLALEQTRRRP